MLPTTIKSEIVIPDNEKLSEISTQKGANLTEKDRQKRIALLEKAADISEKSISKNTKIAYEKDWKGFIQWCENENHDAFNSETLIFYITDLMYANKISTIKRKLVSITKYYDLNNIVIPRNLHKKIKVLLQGIRKVTNYEPNQKMPLVDNDILRMINLLSNDLIDIRNKTFILVGYDGLIRRDALSNICYEDIKFVDEGLIINLTSTKTDDNVKIGLPHHKDSRLCPVIAVNEWLMASGINSGYLFRRFSPNKIMQKERLDGDSMGRIIKKLSGKIGKNVDDIGAHSLRIGKAVQLKRDKTPTVDIMKKGRWKGRNMVDHYTKDHTLFDNEY